MPSFTVQDALDYENTQPFAAMRIEAVGKPAITKIWFHHERRSQPTDEWWAHRPLWRRACMLRRDVWSILHRVGFRRQAKRTHWYSGAGLRCYVGNLVVVGG